METFRFCFLSDAIDDNKSNSDDDETQDSSNNDLSEGEASADNGEIDLVQEYEYSQKQNQISHWTKSDERTDVFIIQEDDILSAVVTSPQIIPPRTPPTSIMKMTSNKSMDNIPDQQQTISVNCFKPKVRFNLDPQYEREREWNKVNKLLGNSVEWTDEFEV